MTYVSGNTRYLAFTLTYPDDWSEEAKRGNNVMAADIASATFLLKRQLSISDEEAAVSKTNADGITLEDGLATVELEPTDTQDLQGKYYGTLRLFLAGGSVQDVRVDGKPYVELTFIQGAVEAVA